MERPVQSLKRRPFSPLVEPVRQRQQVAQNAVPAPLKVFLHPSIPHLGARSKAWRDRLRGLNLKLVQSLCTPGLTHVVVHEAIADDAARLAPLCAALRKLSGSCKEATELVVVSVEWLERCCRAQQLIREGPYRIHCDAGMVLQQVVHDVNGRLPPDAAPITATFGRYARWLGYWTPALADITCVEEFMLQAPFCNERCARVGNSALVKALSELEKYEMAVSDPASASQYRALSYAHAAASVQACSFRITPELEPQQLQQLLPQVGASSARVICTLVRTGTCEQLDCFRRDLPVPDSRGCVRQDSVGGATRRLFLKIPEVGPATAKRFYELGLRSYDDLVLALTRGGCLHRLSSPVLRAPVLYCVQYCHQLAQDISTDDFEEMKEAVLATAISASGINGWQLHVVGGGRRSTARHDADFILTHPLQPPGPVLWQLYSELVASGRLVRLDNGCCRLQQGKMQHLASLKDTFSSGSSDEGTGRSRKQRNLNLDKYDRLFGVFITRRGERRRLDVIVVPHAQLPFGLLGWSGSKQFLRYLKRHARSRGMILNSHCLVRRDWPTPGALALVPHEACPELLPGRGWWPDNGQPQPPLTQITSEEDIFEVLGIPYHPPSERCCP